MARMKCGYFSVPAGVPGYPVRLMNSARRPVISLGRSRFGRWAVPVNIGPDPFDIVVAI